MLNRNEFNQVNIPHNMIKLTVRRESGRFIASTEDSLKKGGYVAESLTYEELCDNVRGGINHLLSGGYHKELGVPDNCPITLNYAETFAGGPESRDFIIEHHADHYSLHSSPLEMFPDFNSVIAYADEKSQSQRITINLRLEEILR